MAGELALVGCGVLFLGMTTIVGALYGAALHLDPTTPVVMATILHGLVAVAFLGVGAALLLASAGLAYGLAQRRPGARAAALGLAAFYSLFGLLPLTAVVLYALLREDVADAFRA